MDFDSRTVERHMIDLNVNNVVFLHCSEHMIEYTVLRPPVGAGIDRVPIAEFLRQPSPFAPLFGDIQNGIEHL